MIIKKTEILIYLDNAVHEEPLVQTFSKEIRAKTAKRSATKKSGAMKAAGKNRTTFKRWIIEM